MAVIKPAKHNESNPAEPDHADANPGDVNPADRSCRSDSRFFDGSGDAAPSDTLTCPFEIGADNAVDENVLPAVRCSFRAFTDLAFGWSSLALSQQHHIADLNDRLDEVLDANDDLESRNEMLSSALDHAGHAIFTAMAIFKRLVSSGVITEDFEDFEGIMLFADSLNVFDDADEGDENYQCDNAQDDDNQDDDNLVA
jgi:hypothetical protein